MMMMMMLLVMIKRIMMMYQLVLKQRVEKERRVEWVEKKRILAAFEVVWV